MKKFSKYAYNSAISFAVWLVTNLCSNSVLYIFDDNKNSSFWVYTILFCVSLGVNLLLGYLFIVKMKNKRMDFISISWLHILIMLLFLELASDQYIIAFVIGFAMTFPHEIIYSNTLMSNLQVLLPFRFYRVFAEFFMFLYSLIPYLFIWFGMVLKRKKEEKELLIEEKI